MSPDRLPPKNFTLSFLIYWLLAERFSSGKRFRQDFYPHSAFSSFSCFKNTFLGTFSSGQIETSLLLGEWFTFWNLLFSWENGLHFGTFSSPGRMVYILELLFSLGEWFSFSTRINLSSQIGGVSLEIHVWGYVKKATRKQRFATCVDIDFVPVFLNFGQVLFSIK